MSGVGQRIVKHSFVYGIHVVLRRVASILMLPVYTRYLTPADYGTLELLSITTEVAALVLGIGLNAALFKFFSDAESDEERSAVISTILILVILLFLSGAAVGIACAGPLSALVFGTVEYAGLFRVVFMTFFFLAVTQVGLRHLQAHQRSGFFVLVGLGLVALQLSLNVYFLVARGLGIRALLYGNLIAQAVTATLLMGAMVREVGVRFSVPLVRPLVRYGAPLIVVNLCAFVYTFGDRYFLNQFASTADVGLYSLAYRFGFMLTFLLQPFNRMWAAERFEVAKRPEAPQVYRRVFNYYLFFLLCAALGIALFARDAIYILATPEFHPAWRVVWILVLAYTVSSVTSFGLIGVLVSGRTEQNSVATFIAAVVALAAYALLIPRWHSTGAAVGTLLCFCVRHVILIHYSQRHIRIPYDWNAILRMAALAAGLLTVSLLAPVERLPLSLGLHAALWLALPVGVYFSGAFPAAERAQFLALLANPRRTLQGILAA